MVSTPVFSYYTLQHDAVGTYKEKGSKFLAFAYPVSSEAEIRLKIEMVKKEYFDARHHCYAWMLGPEKKSFRAFDDGEPNHSAGDPILGQLRSKSLTDVLIIVVRYFGGVKLGVGGLIAAYKTAAEDALNNAVIVEREVCEAIVLQYPYISTPEVMRMVKEFDLVITNQDFTSNCVLEAELARRHKNRFLEKLKLLNATGTEVSVTLG